MTIADDARKAATHFEVVKSGLRQVQAKDDQGRRVAEWIISLRIQYDDLPEALQAAAMGTRYVAALVEVGDDEQPVKPADKPKGGRLAKKAGIHCAAQSFQNFLYRRHPEAWMENIERHQQTSEAAAALLRSLCGIESRSVLDSDDVAAERFDQILNEYEAWKRGLAA